MGALRWGYRVSAIRGEEASAGESGSLLGEKPIEGRIVGLTN